MARDVTVVPVVDYEPPVGAPPRPVLTRHRRARRHLDAVPRADHHPSARAAAMFADAVLRGVLEVVDGRRALAQLLPLLGDALVDDVVALARSRTAAGTAQLRHVRLRIVDRDGEAAEVFATYTRGDRVRAIAGRVECGEIRGRRRWRLTALDVG
jgi:hypothetical protein